MRVDRREQVPLDEVPRVRALTRGPPKVILEISACESIAQQLLETDAPLKDIALGKGFREPAAFNRFFKRITGESPGRYRASRASRTPPVRQDS